MMVDKKGQQTNRIPIRFLDEEKASGMDAAAEADDDSSRRSDDQDSNEPSAEEIGRASIYEDETEVKRRIDRGAEEESDATRERADDSDAAGGPPRDDLPERREDRDEAQSASPSEESSATSPASAGAQSDAAQVISAPAAGPAIAELIATRAELKRVEAERTDLQDRLARRQADFENYRKRVERERGETYNRIVCDVASKLLPVLDNLERALEAESSVESGESEEFRHFLHGVELIYKQLNDVLSGMGVEAVPAVGQRFDPHVHEAVTVERADDFEPDTVIQEIVRGYRLGEKLIRPAMVKVATR